MMNGLIEKDKAKRGHPLLWLLISAAVVGLDQFTKWLAVTNLKGQESFDFIPGVLRFTYVENRGAAFGSFSESRWVFMLFSAVAIVAVIVYLLRFSPADKLLRWIAALIIGGGIGNMIDRIVLTHVVDFIDFYAFPSLWVWVFNVADSAVVISAGLLILFTILEMRAEMKAAKTAAKAAENAADKDAGRKTDGNTEN